MAGEHKTTDLERQYKALLFSSRLPDAAMAPGALPALKLIDLSFARELFGNETWGIDDQFDERGRLVRDVLSISPKGRPLVLAAEIDLMSQARDGRTEICHSGPFGLREWVFPLRVRGQIVHLIRSGKFREERMTEADLGEIADLTGVDRDRVRAAAAAIPVHGAETAGPEAVLLRALRDARQTALEQHLALREVSMRQLGSEKMVALGTMAEGAAQHINHVLSAILGYGALLTDKPEISDDAAGLLYKITDAAQRGRRFTEELLALATASDEEEAVLSLHAQIDSVLLPLQSRLAGRVKLETHLGATRDSVTAPPALLHQVIFNVLSNAIEGMPAGGVLTIRTTNAADEFKQDQVVLDVSDTGGHGSTQRARKSGRAGQTLSSMGEVPPRLLGAFGLITKLDGTIEAAPDEGLTTRVTIQLPVRDKVPVTGSPRRPRRRLAASEIWVADDDPVIREMCRRALGEDGHAIAEFNAGEEVAKVLESQNKKPDLIVYDFSMPDLDGFEFCSRIRDGGSKVPVVLLTGFKADQPDVRETLKLRKTFLLQKPFSFRDMTDLVTVALGETLVEE